MYFTDYIKNILTSGVAVLGVLRSATGFDSVGFGERSKERRGFWVGEGELGRTKDPERLTLPVLGVLGLLGVAGVDGLLLGGVSNNPDLLNNKA